MRRTFFMLSANFSYSSSTSASNGDNSGCECSSVESRPCSMLMMQLSLLSRGIYRGQVWLTLNGVQRLFVRFWSIIGGKLFR